MPPVDNRKRNSEDYLAAVLSDYINSVGTWFPGGDGWPGSTMSDVTDDDREHVDRYSQEMKSMSGSLPGYEHIGAEAGQERRAGVAGRDKFEFEGVYFPIFPSVQALNLNELKEQNPELAEFLKSGVAFSNATDPRILLTFMQVTIEQEPPINYENFYNSAGFNSASMVAGWLMAATLVAVAISAMAFPPAMPVALLGFAAAVAIPFVTLFANSLRTMGRKPIEHENAASLAGEIREFASKSNDAIEEQKTLISNVIRRYDSHKKSKLFSNSSRSSIALLKTLKDQNVDTASKMSAIHDYMAKQHGEMQNHDSDYKDYYHNNGKALYNIIKDEMRTVPEHLKAPQQKSNLSTPSAKPKYQPQPKTSASAKLSADATQNTKHRQFHSNMFASQSPRPPLRVTFIRWTEFGSVAQSYQTGNSSRSTAAELFANRMTGDSSYSSHNFARMFAAAAPDPYLFDACDNHACHDHHACGETVELTDVGADATGFSHGGY